MKILMRVFAGSIVLIGLALVGLAIALPQIVASPGFHATMTRLTEQGIGRPLEYGALSVGLVPPRIEVDDAFIAGPEEADPPLLRVDVISLRLALLPLFSGRVVLDSLVLRGPQIHLIQTADGLQLPTPQDLADSEAPQADPDVANRPISLELRSILLRDGTVTYEDRTAETVARYGIEKLNLTATGTSTDAPIDFLASAHLATGGKVSVTGLAGLDGRVDLHVDLERVGLEPVQPLLPEGVECSAEIDGTIEIEGDVAAPDFLTIDLTARIEHLRVDDLSASGQLALGAKLAGDLTVPSGTFEIDAEELDLAYGTVFAKPRGVRASASGHFAVERSGDVAVDSLRLALERLEAQGSLELADESIVKLDAASFDLVGFGRLIPNLAPYTPLGRIAIERLTVQMAPLALTGRIDLQDVSLKLPDAERVTLRGEFALRGELIEWDAMELVAGGQKVLIAGSVRELATDLPFTLSVRSDGIIRTNELLSAVSSIRNTLYGPLELDVQLTGRAGATGSDTAVTDSLKGTLAIHIGRGAGDGKEGGRLHGVSALRSVMGELERLGSLVLRIGASVSGKSMATFYGDKFERMDGEFAIDGAVLDTKRLRILYLEYGLNLYGPIDLASHSLDMTGELMLGADIVRVLGGKPSEKHLKIPLTSVNGTIDKPKFGVSAKAGAVLVKQLLLENKAVKKVEKDLEKIFEKGMKWLTR